MSVMSHKTGRVEKKEINKRYLENLQIFGSDSKAAACNEEDLGSIPGLGRYPGEGNGNTLQYSCLENPMD